jgi:hypothetical protein
MSRVNADNRLPADPAKLDRTTAFALYAIFRDFARQINSITDQIDSGSLGGTTTTGQTVFLPTGESQDDEMGYLGFVGGAAGAPGANGATGAQGPTGPAIFFDYEGEQGEQGWPGPKGADGVIGTNGAQGPVGPAVYLEAESIEGDMGPPGPAGANGAAGANGSPGAQGPAGPALFFLHEPPEPETAWPGATGATGPQGPAGGGGGSATTVEKNLGATAGFTGKFTITDATISGTSKVLCWQACGPYTGKGTRADEAEMQPVNVICVEPASGSATVRWQTPPMIRPTNLPSAGGQPASAIIPGLKDVQALSMLGASRLGKVRGNVKFTYMVL